MKKENCFEWGIIYHELCTFSLFPLILSHMIELFFVFTDELWLRFILLEIIYSFCGITCGLTVFFLPGNNLIQIFKSEEKFLL